MNATNMPIGLIALAASVLPEDFPCLDEDADSRAGPRTVNEKQKARDRKRRKDAKRQKKHMRRGR